jgi:glycosyltransferase involved in cell wall biosynthesis
VDTLTISFVIPALNEGSRIAAALATVKGAMDRLGIDYEVIVVDHGSRDDTLLISKSAGAYVYEHAGRTISSQRNYGAQKAVGDVLVFLDADVTLTDSWAKNISPVLTSLYQGERIITGSHCAPPESENPFLLYWFSALATDPRNTHLGTGHLIISRTHFADLGMFSEDLATGEDYEFCARAKTQGFTIKNDPALHVVHHDFPSNPAAFIKREAWHSRGDLASLRTAFRSKVVWGSWIFIALHLVFIIGFFKSNAYVMFIASVLLLGLLGASSYLKNRHRTWSTIAANAAIFYFYYLGRSLGFLRHVVRLPIKAAIHK